MTMKQILVVLALVTFCVFDAQAMTPQQYRNGFALLNAVDECELVVLGTVASKDYVNRFGLITTDITVTVEEFVRGTGNVNATTIKFMIEGGLDAARDRRLFVSGEPEFEVGEKVFLFLNDGASDKYYKKYPHGNLHVHRCPYGKRKVENGKVEILYPNSEGEFRVVKMPVELATTLGKASLVDKAAAKRVEQTIKDAVASSQDKEVLLSQPVIESLKLQSKQIIDTEEE